MIIGTNLRRGLILAYKNRPPVVVRIGTTARAGCGGTSSSSSPDAVATAPFSTALARPLESWSSADRTRIVAPPPPSPPPAVAFFIRGASDRRQSFLSSQSSRSIATTTTTTATATTMRPSLRAAIAADLRSVDADADGMISAEELGALLRKHGSAFDEGEVLELSDLFYSSLGGSSVSIGKFLEALEDAAASGGGGGGGAATDGGSLNALGSDGKLKTHPLGIGTCASEYM